MKRLYNILLALLLLSSLEGCSWLRRFQPVSGPQAPRVLADQPSLEQIMGAVNANTARVQSYSSSGARISTPGLPALRANIAVAGSQQFRLRADTVLTGTEVDLGSNAQEFWFWMKRSQPPALYYSSQQAFAASPMKSVLPIEPNWLVEALGMVTFAGDAQHSGPRQVRAGQWEIRSDVRRPSGDLVKITVIDATRAWVMEQHVYTPQGVRIASAVAKDHKFDSATGVSLPTRVDVNIPQAQLNLNLDVSDFQLNRAVGDPQQMFARPHYDGVPEVDLGTLPSQTVAPATVGFSPTSPGYVPSPPGYTPATPAYSPPGGIPVSRLPYVQRQ